MVKGLLTAKYATLVCEFKVPVADLYDLTPRQIQDIYLHPRDDTGAIKAPAVPTTPADPRALITGLIARAGALKLKPDDVEKLKRKLAELDGNPAATS